MQRILLSATIGLAALLPATLHAQCAPGETEVVVAITTDQYGTETTWELTDITGNTVFEDGGPYTNLASPGTAVQPAVSVCIADYTLVMFTIYDEYGDGISSAQYGMGSYSVTMGARSWRKEMRSGPPNRPCSRPARPWNATWP